MGNSAQSQSQAQGLSFGKVPERERTFGEDVDFLAKHTGVVVLGSVDGPQLAVAPAYQGRVMTSSATGLDGISHGWINYDQVTAGLVAGAQINVVGGEERFWLGPEGGQYSLFFAPESQFEFAEWRTPACLDSEPFPLVANDASTASFKRRVSLQNRMGTLFYLGIERRVELMSSPSVAETLQVDTEGLPVVGYRTSNRITNEGQRDWSKASGLLSIWLLGMFKHGPQTTIVLPFRGALSAEAGPVVNDAYFGKVTPDRLAIDDGVVYFRADGRRRGKIGLSPCRAMPVCGSYDAVRQVLTIIRYNQPDSESADYVNSMWNIDHDPYAGDVVNAYNDGPTGSDMEQLGPFYELETSSPALALRKGETGEHIQETYHFEGNRRQLDDIARRLLGVSIGQIVAALP